MFYDVQSGNGVGLLSKEKISKVKEKQGKRISGEVYDINKQEKYTELKSDIESRAHYAPEPGTQGTATQ